MKIRMKESGSGYYHIQKKTLFGNWIYLEGLHGYDKEVVQKLFDRLLKEEWDDGFIVDSGETKCK